MALALVLVHHPVLSANPHADVMSSKLPRLLRNTCTAPQSSASARSGQPSPSRSANVAHLTTPREANGSLPGPDNFNSPWSFTQSVEETGSGYRPGANLPPANKSRSPSPSMSATAIGPMLAFP